VDEILAANGQTRLSYPIVPGPLRPGDQRHMAAEISQTRQILGWEPRTPFPEALKNTMTWARDQFHRTIQSKVQPPSPRGK
jgi:nucleoside-diphosphate-sugar epimerase